MTKARRITSYYISSFLSGALLWLAWPERGFTPLIFLSFVPLLWIDYSFHTNEINRGRLKLFGYFYLSMFTWNVLTTWWIYNSTDIGSLVAIGLNSLFMAIVLQLFHVTKKKLGVTIGYFSLLVYWIAFEYLHLNWEISWPWLTLGNAFASHPQYVQWYEFTGVLGGTLWTLAANIFFFFVVKNIINRDLLVLMRKVNSMVGLSASAILIITPMIFSLWLYHRHTNRGTPVNVTVVQPNIDPYNEKFSGTGAEQLARLLRLASTVSDSSTEYIVAPETALPDGIWEEGISQHKQIKTIENFLKVFPKATMVIGAATYKGYNKNDVRSETAHKFKNSDDYYDAFNTALQIDQHDNIQVYHKSRLVPGVEIMPYTNIFGFLEKYSIDLGGTSGSLGIQKDRTVFTSSNGTKIAPAICYESIYGDFMSGYMKNGAELIFVITNDGWWGNTPGYRQHMNYARLLAIEFRKGIARSANTGISCFINQRGDVLQKTNWWKEDAISQVIYKNDIKTFYAKHGDYLGIISSCFTFLFLLAMPVKSIIRKIKSK
jgi:apolipoprotein N-acyltransferase